MHIKQVVMTDGVRDYTFDFEKLHQLTSKCKICGSELVVFGVQESRLPYLRVECSECGVYVNLPFELMELEAEQLEEAVMCQKVKIENLD